MARSSTCGPEAARSWACIRNTVLWIGASKVGIDRSQSERRRIRLRFAQPIARMWLLVSRRGGQVLLADEHTRPQQPARTARVSGTIRLDLRRPASFQRCAVRRGQNGERLGEDWGGRTMFWVLIAVALTMGFFMAIQPAINGQLRWRTGSPAQAALISTSVSTVSLLLFVFVVQRQPRPSSGAFRGLWWIWTGGLLGAVYVAMSIVLVQRLGGAVAYSLVVLGQMLSALVIDHFGLLGWRNTKSHRGGCWES